MYKVLLTGATGYIGSRLYHVLRGRGHEVYPFIGNVVNGQSWMVSLAYGADVVIHLAALTSLRRCENDVVGALETNIMGTVYGVDLCRSRFILASSVTVEGVTDDSTLHAEATDCQPCSVYEMTKYMAERYTLQRGQSVFRLCNTYGPSPAESNKDRGIVNRFIRKAMGGGVNSVYSCVTNKLRDYIFIDDVVDAFVRYVETPDFMAGVYNVCSGVGHTVLEMARLCGPTEVVDDPIEALHPIELRSWVGNYSKLNRECGWMPRVQLQYGIDRTKTGFLRADLGG